MPEKTKPLRLKILEGNPGHQKLPTDTLEPPDELIEPPDHLDEIALKEWNRVTPGLETMGILCAIDIQILAAYCCAYSIWKQAIDKINTLGIDDKTANGTLVQNPYVGIANTASINMLKFASEFGLSPSVRARIGFDIGKNKKSKFDGLFGKK
jgi:P27 family predicted phage terminase small subunit